MNRKLKDEISNYLYDRGADLIGFSSVETWKQKGIVPEAFRPDSIWPLAKSVIVIGLQMPLPIVETTPSVLHKEAYRTCNRQLDNMAFDLTRWLNRKGYASTFFSRDCYTNINALIRKPIVAFAHNPAAEYSGLGTIGINNTMLTKQYGPRVRFVSVFCIAELSPDQILETNLCIRCGACVECCPVNALTISKDELKNNKVVVANYDKLACSNWHKQLLNRGYYPCGVCIKVCPVGDDRELYKRKNVFKHYRNEVEAIDSDTDDPIYKSWKHIRSYGI